MSFNESELKLDKTQHRSASSLTAAPIPSLKECLARNQPAATSATQPTHRLTSIHRLSEAIVNYVSVNYKVYAQLFLVSPLQGIHCARESESSLF